MNRLARLTLSALGLAAAASPAMASGDYSCTPIWKLAVLGGIECGNRAMLSPGNDTRANMLLLQRGGMAPISTPFGPALAQGNDPSFGRTFFDWSALVRTYATDGDSGGIVSGSRCDSLSAGADAFERALAANARLTADDRETLSKARGNLALRCSAGGQGTVATPWPERLSGVPARAFLGYLQGADAFYAGAWDEARKAFSALRTAPDAWVAETAAYMLIRVELNAAQEQAFDEYGYFRGATATDRAAVARGQQAIAAYLKRYPHGTYAASAQGLKRRALWLGGDLAALAGEYERLLDAAAPGSEEALSLIQEIDNKLLFATGAGQAIRTPQLLAAYDLLRMRTDADETGEEAHPSLSAAELAGQKPLFARQPQLYAYLLAAQAFHVDKDYRRVLSLVPAAAGKDAVTAPLAFSRQMLRGMALAALRDPQEEAHWRALLQAIPAPYQREQAELGLALAWQRSGKLSAIFAPGSPVQDPTIRKILLSRIAGPDLLRKVASDSTASRQVRDVALFTLLQKSLLTGRYADFGRDRMLIPAGSSTVSYLWDFPYSETIPVGLFSGGKWSDGYPCPALSATAATLARNPADPAARLCLADFWRLNGFDLFDALKPDEDTDALGAGPDLFPGTPATRAAIYAAVLADPRTAGEERAYALYRSIRCYAPSGNNDCGGDEVPVAQRQAWFRQLKKDYPSSRWAKSLSYYW
jgi:hypothetical protein